MNLEPKVVLELPEGLPFPRDVTAGWAFYSLDRGKFDQEPGSLLGRVDLKPELERLPLVTPEKPGRYRLSLYLSGI